MREGDLAGRRVLDIGCGTGRALEAMAARGSRVWGVEPEPEMAALARERVSTVKVAPAERLPFKDGWFERALMWLVVHLVDRPRAFGEAARVLRPDGRLAIGTFHLLHFERYWLKEFFPSLEAIDTARFPSPAELESELEFAVEHDPLGSEDAPQKVLVPEESLEAAQHAIEALTEPEEIVDEA